MPKKKVKRETKVKTGKKKEKKKRKKKKWNDALNLLCNKWSSVIDRRIWMKRTKKKKKKKDVVRSVKET